MTNRIELNWDAPYAVDEQRYYCSETPIDVNNLPLPKAVLAGDTMSYVDTDVEFGKTYFVCVGSVKNGVEKLSDQIIKLVGTAWTPSNLTTDAKIWLDSDTAVAGEVSSIANIGSIGGTFNQPTQSLRPYIVESVINEHNVMRLDGVNDIISLVSADAGNLFRNTGKGWFFSVVKSISGYALFDCRTPANSARFLVRANPGVQQINIRRLDSNTTTYVSASAPSDFYIRFDLMDWQTATGKLRQNGLEVASKSLGTAGLTSDTASNSNAISFGNTYLNPVSGEYFGGDIAFAIAGSGVFPTSQEIQKLEGWAAHKYGLTANLPIDHPYKNRIPVIDHAPYNLTAEFKNENNRIELNWNLDYVVDEHRYYFSETPIDVNNLPAPKAVLAGDVRSYVDAAVEIDKTYYVAVGSVMGGIEKVSQELEIFAGSDEHWDKVVGLYRQEGSNIVDLSPFGGSLITNTGLSVDSNVASPTGTPVLKLNANAKAIFTTAQLGLDDFTIEMWFRCDSSHSSWPRVWATKDSTVIGAGHYNAQLRGTTGIAVFAETQRLAERSEDLKNKFSHLAFCKQGDDFYVAIDGVVSVKAYTTINDVNGIFTLGQGEASLIPLWFNEIRITKGIARYTANFTPPDAPFPSY